MKQMVRDIRAAWPRERRFTWRGWVLVGVFLVLAVAAWRGWDPLWPLLVLLSWFDADLPLSAAWNMFVWTWVTSTFPTVSILSIPAITLGLGLARPAVHWAWYLTLFGLVVFMPAMEWAIIWSLQNSRFRASSFPGWAYYTQMLLESAIWGALLARAMHNWRVVGWILITLATALVLGKVLSPYRAVTRGAATVRMFGMTYGVETIVFQLMLVAGVVWQALRSWRVKPEHLCPSCNYDRRGLKADAACPECGAGTSMTCESSGQSETNGREGDRA